jgi:small subunit ribosomal protein S16
MGTKKRPFFRFVATDSRMPRDGRFLDTLGHYNPIVKPAKVKIHEEKMNYWFDQGAEPSDTVKTLLKQIGFLQKYEMKKKGQDVSEMAIRDEIRERPKKLKKKKVAKTAEAAAPAPEAPAQ